MTFIENFKNLTIYNEILKNEDIGNISNILYDKDNSIRKNARERIINYLKSLNVEGKLFNIEKMTSERYKEMISNSNPNTNKFSLSLQLNFQNVDIFDQKSVIANLNSKTVIPFGDGDKKSVDLQKISDTEFSALCKNINFVKILRKTFKEKSAYRNIILNKDDDSQGRLNAKEWLKNKWKILAFFNQLKRIFNVKNSKNKIVIDFNTGKLDLELTNIDQKINTTEVSKILFKNGYNRILYEIGVCYDKNRAMFSIHRAIENIINKTETTDDEKNILNIAYDNMDDIYDNNYKIIFSLEPKAVISQSTGVDWYSCMNLTSNYTQKKYVGRSFNDGGNCVVYVTKTNDLAIKKPLARLLVKPMTITNLGDINLKSKNYSSKHKGMFINYVLEKIYTSSNMSNISVPQSVEKEKSVLNQFQKKIDDIVQKVNKINLKKIILLTKKEKLNVNHLDYNLSSNNYTDSDSSLQVNLSTIKLKEKINKKENFNSEEKKELIDYLIKNQDSYLFDQITKLLFQKKYLYLLKEIKNNKNISKKVIADLTFFNKIDNFLNSKYNENPIVDIDQKEMEKDKNKDQLSLFPEIEEDEEEKKEDEKNKEKKDYFKEIDNEKKSLKKEFILNNLREKVKSKEQDFNDEKQDFLSKEMKNSRLSEINLTEKEINDLNKEINKVTANKINLPFITKGSENIILNTDELVYSTSRGSNSPNNLKKIDKSKFVFNLTGNVNPRYLDTAFQYNFNGNMEGKFHINDFINVKKNERITQDKINVLKDIFQLKEINFKPIEDKKVKEKMEISFDKNFNKDFIYNFKSCSLDFSQFNKETKNDNEAFILNLNESCEVKNFPKKYYIYFLSNEKIEMLNQISVFYLMAKNNIINNIKKNFSNNKEKLKLIQDYFDNKNIKLPEDINRTCKGSLPQNIYIYFDFSRYSIDTKKETNYFENIKKMQKLCSDFNIGLDFFFAKNKEEPKEPEKSKEESKKKPEKIFVKENIENLSVDDFAELALKYVVDLNQKSFDDDSMIGFLVNNTYFIKSKDNSVNSLETEIKNSDIYGKNIYLVNNSFQRMKLNDDVVTNISIKDNNFDSFLLDLTDNNSSNISFNRNKDKNLTVNIKINDMLKTKKTRSITFNEYKLKELNIEGGDSDVSIFKSSIGNLKSNENLIKKMSIDDSEINNFDESIYIKDLEIKNYKDFVINGKLTIQKLTTEGVEKISNYQNFNWDEIFKLGSISFDFSKVKDLSNIPFFVKMDKKEEIKKYLKNEDNIIYVNVEETNEMSFDEISSKKMLDNFLTKLNFNINKSENENILDKMLLEWSVYQNNKYYKEIIVDLPQKIRNRKNKAKEKIEKIKKKKPIGTLLKKVKEKILGDSFVSSMNHLEKQSYFD